MVKPLAQYRFIVPADQPKVWDLLAAAIYRQLPLEQVDIESLDHFNALLRWRLGFVSLPFHVQGKLEGVSRPDAYGCMMVVKKGPVRLSFRVIMTLKAIEKTGTEISCVAIEGPEKSLAGWLLRGQLRRFSLKMFESVAERLKQIC